MKTLKHILFILCSFLFGATTLIAQHQIKAVYTHQNNTSVFQNTTTYTLYANQYKSSYKFILPKQKREVLISEIDESNFKIISYNDNRNEYYIDLQTSEINQLYTMTKKLTVAVDTPPKLEWKISSESKKIGDYTVIKAETFFRGRDYIAWFAPAIPISAGPWKLFGLPGLILEAEDKEADYSWHLTSLEEVDVTKEVEILDTDYTKMSLKEALGSYFKQKRKEAEIEGVRRDNQSTELLGFQTKTLSTKTIRNNQSSLERFFEWEDD